MPHDNVQLLLAMADAWNAGDMETVRRLLHREVVLRPPEDWPESGPFVGRDDVMRQYEQLRRTWDADTVDPISELVPVGDRVLVRVAWRGSGRGPAAGIEFSQIYTFREGKVIAVDYFWDHEKAREALGAPG